MSGRQSTPDARQPRLLSTYDNAVTAEDIERQANPRREKAGAIFFGEPCKAIAALPAAFRASEPNKPFD
jgi:hypothetical protein